MSATLIVAIYASVVATSGVVWQIFQWRHARQHQFSVTVAFAFFPFNNGEIEEGVSINAINAGDRPMRVTSVGLNLQDTSRRTFVLMQPPAGATVPGVVQPRDSGMTYIYRDDVEGAGIDLHEPVTAWVDLSTGDRVTSKPHRCLSRD